MRLIAITPAVKKRAETLIKNIFPGVGYVKVARSGLVTMKKKWYSLKRNRVPLTDLLLHSIPNRISQVAEKRGFGVGYNVIFNSALNAMLQMISINHTWDIMDYIWEQYNRYCVTPIPPSRIMLQDNKVKNSQLVPFISLGSIYNFDRILNKLSNNKKRIERSFKEELSRRISNLPVVRFKPLFIFNHA